MRIYQNIKIVLQKYLLQIGLNRFLRFKKSKILHPGDTLLVTSRLKKLLEPFMKKSCKRQAKQNSKLKK